MIGYDYFSAYRRYMRVCGIEIQFYLAHRIGDLKILTTLTKAYGERLRRALKQLFEVTHRREKLSAVSFDRELASAPDRVLAAGRNDVPSIAQAQLMAKGIRTHCQGFSHSYHAGNGNDEQPRGANDPLCGD